jgi:pimeloyl-ACP methyl ester carboxylesterase
MKKGWKITLIILASLLILLLVGPFLVPVPPLQDTVPPHDLAGPEDTFIEINGLSIHYELKGQGKPVFILLHGFGASTFSWREVIDPLSKIGTVLAYDRPAFGLTERPLTWEGENPYSPEGNINLLLGIMDAFDIEQAVLVGNSAGGTLATAFALDYPDRVQALVEVDAAIYRTMPESALLTWLLRTPQMDHLGPLISRRLAGRQGEAFIRKAWYDPTYLDSHPEVLAGYRLPLQAENWDRALWELTKANTASNLANRLDQINIPVLVISGAEDQIVPVENSERLAAELPNADLVIIDQCGHLPQEECPQDFLQAIIQFLNYEMEENNG